MSCRAKSFHVHSNLHRESLIPQLTRSWLAEYLVECRVFDKIERTESREVKDRKEVPESRSRHNSATIGQEGGLQDVVSGTMCCAERVTGTRRSVSVSGLVSVTSSGYGQPVPVYGKPPRETQCPGQGGWGRSSTGRSSMRSVLAVTLTATTNSDSQGKKSR